VHAQVKLLAVNAALTTRPPILSSTASQSVCVLIDARSRLVVKVATALNSFTSFHHSYQPDSAQSLCSQVATQTTPARPTHTSLYSSLLSPAPDCPCRPSSLRLCLSSLPAPPKMNGSDIKKAAIQKAKQVAHSAASAANGTNNTAKKRRKQELKPIITSEQQEA
jgi:hypothetical protein